MDGLIVGRVVHYVLSESDAREINEKHAAAHQTPIMERIPGIQYHIGNPVQAGEHCTAVITQVWDKQTGYVNLKVLLDAQDDHWAISKTFSDLKEPSTWHWIEKA